MYVVVAQNAPHDSCMDNTDVRGAHSRAKKKGLHGSLQGLCNDPGKGANCYLNQSLMVKSMLTLS